MKQSFKLISCSREDIESVHEEGIIGVIVYQGNTTQLVRGLDSIFNVLNLRNIRDHVAVYLVPTIQYDCLVSKEVLEHLLRPVESEWNASAGISTWKFSLE